jgi:hypothetical protein
VLVVFVDMLMLIGVFVYVGVLSCVVVCVIIAILMMVRVRALRLQVLFSNFDVIVIRQIGEAEFVPFLITEREVMLESLRKSMVVEFDIRDIDWFLLADLLPNQTCVHVLLMRVRAIGEFVGVMVLVIELLEHVAHAVERKGPYSKNLVHVGTRLSGLDDLSESVDRADALDHLGFLLRRD